MHGQTDRQTDDRQTYIKVAKVYKLFSVDYLAVFCSLIP